MVGPRGALASGEQPIVTLSTLDWPPYIGPDLPDQGWVAETLRRALNLQGFRVRLQWRPWARAVHEAREGKAEGVLPVYSSDARRRDFLLSHALPTAAVRLFARVEDVARLDGLSIRALSALHLGVVRGYVNPPLIDDGDFRWSKDEASSDLLNLRKLVFGRVDLAVADELVAAHLAASDGDLRGRIAPLTPSLGPWPTYVAVRRPQAGQTPDAGQGAFLQLAIDQGLARLRASGELLEIVQRHGLGGQLGDQARPLADALVPFSAAQAPG